MPHRLGPRLGMPYSPTPAPPPPAPENIHRPASMRVLTWTKIKLLRTCPLMCKRAYLDRAPEAASVPLERGSACHEWLEEIQRRLMTGEDLTQEDLYHALVRRAALLNEEAAADLREIAAKVIARGWVPELPSDATDVAVERPWAVREDRTPCDFEDPDALVRSLFDRVYIENAGATGVIDDWKTNRVIAPDWDQLRLYGWGLLCHEPGLGEVVGRLHFLRYGAVRIAPAKLMDPARLRVEVPAELVAVRDDIDRRMATGEWEPRVSSACHWCSYQNSCPAFKCEFPPVDPIGSPEEAFRRAGELVVMEAMAKGLRDSLKAWVDANGDIPLGDEVVGYSRVEKKSVANPREAMRFLRKALADRGYAGEPADAVLWDNLSLPKAGLWKIVRYATADVKRGGKKAEQAAIFEAIEAAGLLETKVETKFGRRKAGAEEVADDE